MSAVPVALFTYNRPEHARRTVEALGKNELAAQTDLIVFSDAPGRINDAEPVRRVREYIDTISGFKSVRIVPRSRNLGLARSVIDGVTQVCGEFGRAIILEDDLVTSSFFLSFMNKALDSYASEDRVGSVHGYWYPTGAPLPNTFFLRIASSWGWATWARAWRLFERDGTRLLTELRDRGLAHDFDLDGAMPYTKMLEDQIAGRNDSWAIRWDASLFLAGKLSLYPGKSMIRNIGFDGSGRHSPASKAYDSPLAEAPVAVESVEPVENAAARAALIHYYRAQHRGLLARAASKIRRIAGL